MGFSPRLLAAILLTAGVVAVSAGTNPLLSFNRNFAFPSWCTAPYCTQSPDGVVTLAVTKDSVGVFESKDLFSYGVFSVRMKLPSGYSGGIIPCLYLINPGEVSYTSIHDEIDLEFLGGTDPKNITIHTNLITGGQVKLEQYRFPFDPSLDFHTYTIVYSPVRVMWLIDNTPIRITNIEAGKPFPSGNVKLKASIWDASSWSKLKPSWKSGAIKTQYTNFDVRFTCRVPPSGAKPPCSAWRNPARAPWMGIPSKAQLTRFQQFQKSYTVKNYPWASTK